METTHYLNHYKLGNMFIDYYSHEKDGITKYIVKVDWKTMYNDYDQLTKDQILLIAFIPEW